MIRKKIISINVNQGSVDFFTNHIIDVIKKGKNGYICFANVHMLIEAYDDKAFRKVVNDSLLTLPDGFPVAKGFKYFYGIEQDRIAGMDYFPYFLEVCNAKRFKVAFIGGSDITLEKVANKINANFSNIEITNLISPPFNKDWDTPSYIRKINESQTDVVFVALGCPKQEKWMYENYKDINAVLFGVGGAVPTYTGEFKRAPLKMQKLGLEWLHRLAIEPKRMFKRYMYTNSKFICLGVKEFFIKK